MHRSKGDSHFCADAPTNKRQPKEVKTVNHKQGAHGRKGRVVIKIKREKILKDREKDRVNSPSS